MRLVFKPVREYAAMPIKALFKRKIVCQSIGYIVDGGCYIQLLTYLAGYLIAGIHNGGVMLAAERLADIGIGDICKRAAEVHGYMPRHGYALIAP